MGEKVTADPLLREKLAAANGHPVELCDEAGRPVGYALTPEQHRALWTRIIIAETPPEELDRRAAAAETSPYTMDDVLRLFGVAR